MENEQLGSPRALNVRCGTWSFSMQVWGDAILGMAIDCDNYLAEYSH